jgi:hypothetical protein
MSLFKAEIADDPNVVVNPGDDLGGQSSPVRTARGSGNTEDDAIEAAWRDWDEKHPSPRPGPDEVSVRVMRVD